MLKNLSKQIKDLYNENYKTLLKEIKNINGTSMFMNWKI